MVEALQDAPDHWRSELRSAIQTAEDIEDWTFKAKLVIVALHLGMMRPAQDMLEFRDIGVTEICLELKNHQEHGIKLLGERILPAIR